MDNKPVSPHGKKRGWFRRFCKIITKIGDPLVKIISTVEKSKDLGVTPKMLVNVQIVEIILTILIAIAKWFVGN